MDIFTATVDIKCRVTRADSLKPRKELSQRFDRYNLKTQVMDGRARSFSGYLDLWKLKHNFGAVIMCIILKREYYGSRGRFLG